MITFTPPQCENCISYDNINCSCREESSSLFGGNISRYTLPVISLSV